MILDCAIIGGGPAGLNAALVLGRARRSVVLFDNNKPRNAVTHESHGFITRDGVKPAEFREIAHRDIAKYPSVQFRLDKVVQVTKEGEDEIMFLLTTEAGETYRARTLLLATGLKETFPAVPGIHDYYGKSIFSCPYCDGWELRDKPLVLLTETEHAFHVAKIIFNWSRDLVLCTNTSNNLTQEQRDILIARNIQIYDQRITSLVGENGLLEKVIFEDGSELAREGGFITQDYSQAATIGESLGCELNPRQGIAVDVLGRTNIKGVYAAGDMSLSGPAQLINAAAEGSRAAIGVNSDLTEADFK